MEGNPARALAEELLTPGARKELRVASLTSLDQATIRLRVDPGHVFERTACLHHRAGEGFTFMMTQQYCPGEDLRMVNVKKIEPASFVDVLRQARDTGERIEARKHWLWGLPVQVPRWDHRIPVAGGARAAEEACLIAAVKAHECGSAQFVFLEKDDYVCTNYPPLVKPLFSVNSDGEWSRHLGRETFPLEDISGELEDISGDLPPNLRKTAAQVARRDVHAGITPAAIQHGEAADELQGARLDPRVRIAAQFRVQPGLSIRGGIPAPELGGQRKGRAQ